ncbi:hypothetical protein [Pseudoflavitalea rhizosphaerae]|uniref:hypothetical protein n=1 Tax=Pseudoflavitalea rhizosphaerae TaxID=1884793 RepID=UPI000F8D6A2F|nr:hypothetical protein [Pseudoflavitalea rhizosphaerae]
MNAIITTENLLSPFKSALGADYEKYQPHRHQFVDRFLRGHQHFPGWCTSDAGAEIFFMEAV